MSLKELTKDKHAEAETTAFMKAVFDKKMPMSVWIDYTYQKALWYGAIEERAKKLGLLKDLEGIERARLIIEDYHAMEKPFASYNTYKEISKEYAIYIKSLDDPKRVLAHLYTWHMGDMFGGQMIKKIIEAPSRHLEFDNMKTLITNLRTLLTDDLADEANIAFEWAIKILHTYDDSLGQDI
jgi:heme oxygenase